MSDSQDDFETAPDHFSEELKSHHGIFHGLKFYFADDINKDYYKSAVSKLGGVVLEEPPKEVQRDQYIVSHVNTFDLPTVDPLFISNSLDQNTLLNVGPFLLPPVNERSEYDVDVSDTSRIDSRIRQASAAQAEEEDARGTQHDDVASAAVAAAEAASLAHEHTHATGRDVVRQKIDDARQELASSTRSGALDTNTAQSGQVGAVGEPAKAMLTRSSNLPPHNKSSFTEEEDEFILDVVRKNPTRRTTHTLFDEISHYVPNHTGNSIRHRYRVYLSKRLNYVYKVDENGKLLRDEKGEFIKTDVLPQGLKRKFTADEDYQLALNIKKQFYKDIYQVDPDTGESLIRDDDEPSTVAKRKMVMDPTFIPGKEPSFQDYNVGDRRGPLSREFFKTYGEKYPSHTENAWRDRFRKFLLNYGIDEYIAYYENEQAHNRVPEPMKNMTNRVKRPGPAPGNYNNAKKVKFMSPTSQQAHSASTNQYTIPQDDLLDEETLSFITGLKRDLSRMESHQNQAPDIPFEYTQELAESIRNNFTMEETQFDNINPDEIPFPPQIATTDLFMPEFFHFATTRDFLNKVHEIVNRTYHTSQAEKLVEDLRDECGIRKAFSTSILTALSGDLMVLPRYFLCAFRYSANPPMNVPGIWTKEDDEMLKNNSDEDMKLLIKKHGSGRIEMRKRFHQNDLV
ncbi:ABL180Wp [Eremothecium gossypii ATCC 10895]|uniref:DNA-binding protein RAP1 n=1 Tax=Eremothecium gossypii (strain ATCC 10895 / CBS 109.51 / FGSC 9923 / NRRL Y-1056) TaxID=284811 RepID=Q75E50_EREGS|nr:ABL180Wp [Eremothecium gossypii ATCC 10895]AAS50591.1 ABL180Wp [Eremothecium gossypii ATCC 10895]